jgi:HEAT repeat protein
LSNPDESIRAEAMQAAGELGLRSARPVLLDQLEEEEDLLMRHEIIWALSQIGGEGVRNRLEELFELEQDDEEADFLEEAIQNLAFTEDLGPFDLFEFGPDEDE